MVLAAVLLRSQRSAELPKRQKLAGLSWLPKSQTLTEVQTSQRSAGLTEVQMSQRPAAPPGLPTSQRSAAPPGSQMLALVPKNQRLTGLQEIEMMIFQS